MQPISRGALYQTVPSMLGQVDLNLMQHSSFYVNSRKKSQYIFKKSSFYLMSHIKAHILHLFKKSSYRKVTHLIFKKSSYFINTHLIFKKSSYFINTHLIFKKSSHHTTSNSLNRTSFIFLIQAQTAHTFIYNSQIAYHLRYCIQNPMPARL